jgi:hypothetical protein
MADEDEDLFGPSCVPNRKIKLIIGGINFTNAPEEILDEVFNLIEDSKYTTTCIANSSNTVELDIKFKDNTIEKRTFNTCKTHPDCIFFGSRCTKIIPDSDTYKPKKYRIPNEPELMTESYFQRLAGRLCK